MKHFLPVLAILLSPTFANDPWAVLPDVSGEASEGNYLIDWTTVVGQTYQLERWAGSGEWQPMGPVLEGTGGPMVFADPIVEHNLYRIQVDAGYAPVARMLTIGTSYDYYFSTTIRTDELLSLAGKNADCFFSGDGGLGFDEDIVRPLTLEAIAAAPWSHASLQDRPLGLTEATRATHIAAGVGLATRFFDASPDCRVLLQETPAYAVGHPWVNGTLFANTEVMWEQVSAGYAALQAELRATFPAKTFPIQRWGLAVWAMGGNYPESNPDFVDLHDPDNSHPNADSQCLHIFTRFVALTGLDPTPWAQAMIDGQAEALPSIARLEPTLDPEYLATFAYNLQRFGHYPPTFPRHPVAIETLGGEASFAVDVRASPVANLQWYRDGVELPGQTNAVLQLSGLDESDDGAKFYCIATNSCGSRKSAEAVLTSAGRLVPPFSIDLAHNLPSAWHPNGYSLIADQAGGVLTSYVGVPFPIYSRAGVATGYTFTLVSSTGGGTNSSGATGQVLGTPDGVGASFWYSATGGSLVYKISGLPETPITFKIYGARTASGANRQTDITLAGATSEVLSYDAGNTPDTMPEITITPDANGEVIFTQTSGAGNNSGFNCVSFILAEQP